MKTLFLLLAFVLLTTAAVHADPAALPLVCAYNMEPGPDAAKLVDVGPLHLDGRLDGNVHYADGGHTGTGHALQFGGQGSARVDNGGFLNRLGAPLTVTLWVKPERFADGGSLTALLTKTGQFWIPKPFGLMMTGSGRVEFAGSSAGGGVDGALHVGQWTHLAVTFQPNGQRILYVDGQARDAQGAGPALYSNDEPLVLGSEPGYDFPGGHRSDFKGDMDDVHIYAAALSAGQINADKAGASLPTRAAQEADLAVPAYAATLRLVRWDMPFGFRDYRGQTRQDVQKRPGLDAADWPTLTLSVTGKTQTLFADGPEQGVALPEQQGEAMRPVFQKTDDAVINPGGHWLRALKLVLWGRRDVYTTDPTARSQNDYELWTFPVKITGPGQADVRSVSVSVDGQTCFAKDYASAPLRSLTLQLPQNAPGHPYKVSVNGRPAVSIRVGLKPFAWGDPRYEQIPVHLSVPGSPVLSIATLSVPETFPNQKEWDEDAGAVKQAAAFRDASAGADTRRVPLLAHLPMEPDAHDTSLVPDVGALGLSGRLTDGATFADGGHNGKGHAVRLDGKKARVLIGGDPLNALDNEVSFTAWIRPDALPAGDRTALVTKRPGWWAGLPFALDLGADGHLGLDLSGGPFWPGQGQTVTAGAWQHVAFTYKSGGKMAIYHDGQLVGDRDAPGPLKNNGEPLALGWEQGGDFPGGHIVGFNGLMDDVRVYSVALSAAQVKADMAGTLGVRAAVAAKNPVPAPFVPKAIVSGFTAHVGVDVPRSPLTVYGLSLTHGMSGGFKFHSEQGPSFGGSVDDYAGFLSAQGFDLTFEQTDNGVFGNPTDPNSYENWMAAMARHGLRAGINMNALNDASLALYSAGLPDFHAPKVRDAQLLTQRFAAFSNFAGASMGADNSAYSWYWDWNGPTSEHPWGAAVEALVAGGSHTLPVPLGFPDPKAHEKIAPEHDFLAYIDRYNQSFARLSVFADAVREAAPGAIVTSGSFGSSAGVGARGGYEWGTVPGREMFSGLPVLQSYDWDETDAVKPLHNVALLDRLRSYYPEKPAFALLDDFGLKYGRETMQRQYALALTRGATGLGTNFLANPDNTKSKPGYLDWQRDLHQWMHTYGGVYARTQPLPTVGILYVNEQALSRRVQGDQNPPDDVLLHGSHEGKTTEALFLCHAAGWPAKIVTPEEMKRGLPPSVKVLLLVGLNKIDDTWHWYDNLGPLLASFVQGGGHILADDESVCPVPCTKTGMAVRAYIIQGDGGTGGPSLDKTPVLLSRNADNIAKLRAVMKTLDVEAPLAASADPTIWAIPTHAGATQYVTVVNEGFVDGQNATRVIKPQTGTLTWNTTRPIYDVRAARRLSPAEAKTVDLTHDGFEWYALPPATVSVPKLSVSRGADGFYVADVSMPPAMTGIPVRVTVTRDGKSATVYTATGMPARLPLSVSDAPGAYVVAVTELLTNLKGKPVTVQVKDGAPPVPPDAARQVAALKKFAARRVPLTVALTPAQAADPQILALARRVQAWYQAKGRTVSLGSAAPGGVVLSLQPLNAAQVYPRWKTTDTDLVLFGSPADNVLVLDEARGFLLLNTSALAPGAGTLALTYSPFVGGCQAVNVLGNTPAALSNAVRRLTGTP